MTQRSDWIEQVSYECKRVMPSFDCVTSDFRDVYKNISNFFLLRPIRDRAILTVIAEPAGPSETLAHGARNTACSFFTNKRSCAKIQRNKEGRTRGETDGDINWKQRSNMNTSF